MARIAFLVSRFWRSLVAQGDARNSSDRQRASTREEAAKRRVLGRKLRAARRFANLAAQGTSCFGEIRDARNEIRRIALAGRCCRVPAMDIGRIYSCDDHLDLWNLPRDLWTERLPANC